MPPFGLEDSPIYPVRGNGTDRDRGMGLDHPLTQEASPVFKVLHAMSTATSPLEHAVFTCALGPRRSKNQLMRLGTIHGTVPPVTVERSTLSGSIAIKRA